MALRRTRFEPSPAFPESSTPPLVSDGSVWVPLISCPADFPPEIFHVALLQMILHPEYNSTLILRAEILSDTVDIPSLAPSFEGLCSSQNIHRKLLPRRPGRDSEVEQHCTFYGPDAHGPNSVLVITPVIRHAELPYYHPKVFHLAFRYINNDPPILRIEALPHPDAPTDTNSRLYRTCLSLLDTVHRYGWGAMTNYKKRVEHDCLVAREPYQDFYLIMRERHKHLVDSWHEGTDPLKHVFEDIGIASYLILLWKETFANECETVDDADSDTPWKNWPRPPGGFLDLGCGNGLLVHILTSEGYAGHGIDVRARTSWEHYPPSTQQHLHVYAFDPTVASPSKNDFFNTGVFIIGNHADELTPWVPVLSTLHDASGYLSIPCCPFIFDARFERSKSSPFPEARGDEGDYDSFAQKLNLGGESNTSSYAMYRIWLASLSLHCGWQVECDTLRIPSTRNWAIIGRKRVVEDKALENVKEIIQSVQERGIFKPRTPEGNSAH